MDNEVLVRVEDISKKFCRNLKKSLWYGIKDIGREFFNRGNNNVQLRSDEFWALHNISFELKRGECLGLIGPNGAGKSTILKLLNGLIKPDVGRISVTGRVGALIELGAGFNPILSGRENIFINAAVLGIKKREIVQKIDGIIDFSDLKDFLDMPVQSYSSGMKVRLGFAIATALDPDVLLIDEVLSVGDAKFRNKCYKRVGKMRRDTATILVSHSMEQILQNCSNCIVLDKGQFIFGGSTSTAIDIYQKLNESDDSYIDEFESLSEQIKEFNISFNSLDLNHGDTLELKVGIVSNCSINSITIRVMIYSLTEAPIAEWNSKRKGLSYCLNKGKNCFKIDVGPLIFKSGSYAIGVIVTEDSTGTALMWSYKKHKINLRGWTKLGAQVAY